MRSNLSSGQRALDLIFFLKEGAEPDWLSVFDSQGFERGDFAEAAAEATGAEVVSPACFLLLQH